MSPVGNFFVGDSSGKFGLLSSPRNSFWFVFVVNQFMLMVFAQPVYRMQVSSWEAQLSEQLFPAHCLKLSPTPCCFTWFHNTVCGASPQSHCRSSCPGEESARIVILPVCFCLPFPVHCLRFAGQERRGGERRDKSFIPASVASVASINDSSEPTCRKRSANSCPLTVALLCSSVKRNFPVTLIKACLCWVH